MVSDTWGRIYALLRIGKSYREIGRQLSMPRWFVKQEVQQAFQSLASIEASVRCSEDEAMYQFLLPRFPEHLTIVYRQLKAREPMPEPRPIAVITGKIRINELARQLEVPSHSLIDLLPEIGITAKKTHSSTLEKEEAELLRKRVLRLKDEEEQTGPHPTDEFVGLALVDGRFRLLAMQPDGTYRYLDSSGDLHDLIFTVSSQTKALEHAIEELEELLNSRTAKEADFQNFFENNPGFITTDDHIEARADIYLTRDSAPTLKPDFMLKPLDPCRTSDLLELKLPSAQLYVLKARRERLSQAVMEARAQLLEYARYFDDAKRRESIRSTYGVFAYRPRMFVVIGRRGTISPVIRRNAELTADDITLRTYDDIVDRMKQRVKSMRSGSM